MPFVHLERDLWDLRDRHGVSPLYVATSQAGRAIDALAGQPLLHLRRGQPSVDVIHVNWHTIELFKSHGHQAA